jgi:hypothetical protein
MSRSVGKNRAWVYHILLFKISGNLLQFHWGQRAENGIQSIDMAIIDKITGPKDQTHRGFSNTRRKKLQVLGIVGRKG